MKITKEVVRHVAGLGRLNLKDSEIDSYQDHLAKVINYIDQLSEVSTDGVKPFLNPMRENESFYLSGKNLRNDTIAESISKEDLLKNAPDKAYGQFKLEAVIESE